MFASFIETMFIFREINLLSVISYFPLFLEQFLLRVNVKCCFTFIFETLCRHGVKVGPGSRDLGPRDPRTRDLGSSQSLKVGTGPPKVQKWSPRT